MLIICQVGNKPTQTEELKVEKKAITAFSLYFLLQLNLIVDMCSVHKLHIPPHHVQNLFLLIFDFICIDALKGGSKQDDSAIYNHFCDPHSPDFPNNLIYFFNKQKLHIKMRRGENIREEEVWYIN